MYWKQQTSNYREQKDEITEKATNHTNKLIDNFEKKFRQINENIERKQEETLEIMFNRLERTLDDINRQNNLRTETRNSEKNNIQKNRQPETQTRRTNSITTEERETTGTEPPLQFYKQLTSMSINAEPQTEQNIRSGSYQQQ